MSLNDDWNVSSTLPSDTFILLAVGKDIQHILIDSNIQQHSTYYYIHIRMDGVGGDSWIEVELKISLDGGDKLLDVEKEQPQYPKKKV